MKKAFRDKSAIVTGGASGIGRAVAIELARHGAFVVIADRDEPRALEAAQEIRQSGPNKENRAVDVAKLDVTDCDAVEALVDRVADERGRLDYMFNNAGIAVIGDAHSCTRNDWDRLIDINIRGVVYGTMAAYRRMMEQRDGHIVNTASMAGLVPSPRFTAYSATKHAVVGLSTSLRFEAREHGVRVSVVCPGIIDTPMAHNSELRGSLEGRREEMISKMPIGLYPVARCAEDIVRGVAKNEAVIVVTPMAKAAVAMRRVSGGLADWLTHKALLRQM